MSSFTQKNRRLKVYSDLTENTLLIHKLKAKEAISQLFEYQLSLLSLESNIDPKKIISQAMSFTIEDANNQAGEYNGVVTSLHKKAFKEGDFYCYEVTLSPALWFLSQRSHCRIFQNKKLSDIMYSLLSNVDNLSYEFNARDTGPVEYCVQYNETDLDFLTRLLERYGCYYYFNQSKAQHKLIISDKTSSYGSEKQEILEHFHSDNTKEQVIDWEHQYNFFPGKITYNSHDFKKPSNKVMANTQTTMDLLKQSQYEMYETANNCYQEKEDGQQLCLQKVEALEARYDIVVARSTYVTLNSGDCIELDLNCFPTETTSKFVITDLSFSAEDNSYFSNNVNKGYFYENSFSCIANTKLFRPLNIGSKPVIAGPQEAIVTGADNDEIFTDEFGRIKVKFYWDIEGRDDGTSSCWLRCLTSWEGVPRVGNRVVVDFIDGDIDQPMVLGLLHDDYEKPLYALTENKTKSSLKRRSGAHGDSATYNELLFEDKKDSQCFYSYAAKDKHTLVENDLTCTLNEGSNSLVINKGDIMITVKEGQYQLKVKGNIALNSDGDISLAAKNINMKAEQAVNISSGTEIKQKAGTSITSEANVSINQKASASLSMKTDGMAELESSGILTLKGTLTQVN